MQRLPFVLDVCAMLQGVFVSVRLRLRLFQSFCLKLNGCQKTSRVLDVLFFLSCFRVVVYWKCLPILRFGIWYWEKLRVEMFHFVLLDGLRIGI